MTERLAFVTGGGSGIGAAIARAASRAGYRVAIMDAQADAAAAMARELGNAVHFPVTSPMNWLWTQHWQAWAPHQTCSSTTLALSSSVTLLT